jgi:glycosyltransferase involved in cell wall biosynthesis
MRIGINIHKIKGPYGGANQFANVLEKHLRKHGHEVTREILPKLDIILIISSQKHPKTTTFDIQDIQDYIALHPETVVVHRVNTLDENRGSDLGINRAVLEANRLADHTVFVSTFVKNFFEKKGMDLKKPYSIILNGADEEIFFSHGRLAWQPGEKMRIVTHHWSANYLKGFDIYERLDQLLGTQPFQSLFEFYFIGNLPLGLELKNTLLFPPAWGKELGDLLRGMHIYLTAARLEASGQHHVEGMGCGLPVLYLNSGALPEYCEGYGLDFNLLNFEEKLLEIRSKYAELYPAVMQCPYGGERMSSQFENLFSDLVTEKKQHKIPKVKIGTHFYIRLIKQPSRKVKRLMRLGQKAIKFIQEP